MDSPRSRSKKIRKKSSRQASPEYLKHSSRSTSSMQPEAGPSRIRVPQQPAVPPAETFSSDADFIAFEVEEDARPRQPPREWDKGKLDRDSNWDRDRDKDGQMAGRKRRWEESERDGASTARNSNVRKSSLKSRKAPWTAHVDWDSCRNVAEMLHKEVEAYLLYISPTPVEHEVRWMIVQLISSSIKKIYPDAEVLPFGSFGTKLYLPQGDIDLVVQSQILAYNEKVSALRSLANIVKRSGVTDKVTVISKTRVPIIKFVTLYGRFAVDISMNQSNGVQTGDMINRFLDEFPALRALVLIVKSFLKHRNLNEVYSGGLGSYAIVCLAVSHLQMHPKVRRAEIDSAKNLGVLMLEFFELYGKYFNYANTGISLRHGGSYFSKEVRGWKDYNKPYLLCIEDPGDISNDISRGSFGIKKVRQTFAGAYDMMLSALYVSAEILGARQDARAVDLRRGSTFERNPDEMSLLSSILGVEQETINHRRLVQDVHDKGTLARMLGVDPQAELGVPKTAEKRSRAREAQSVVAAWGEADMVLDSDEKRADHVAEVNGRKGRKRDADDSRGSEGESRYGIVARGSGRVNGHQSPGQSRSQRQPEIGPTRKRRRTATAQDVRSAPAATLFVPDEDEGEDENSDEDNENESVELLEYYADPNPADSSDGLDEIERAYAAAADALADVDEGEDEDEDSAYTKGSKSKGKERRKARESTANPLRSDQRRAFWASKAVQDVVSDSS